MTRMQAVHKPGTAKGRRAAVKRRLGLTLVLAGGLLGGCGIGAPVAEGSAALLSGMPKCDPSLLHPRIEVGAAAGLPGKLIVYVDGVMACVDDAGRVDQLMTQIEGKGLGSSLTLPASTPAPATTTTTSVTLSAGPMASSAAATASAAH